MPVDDDAMLLAFGRSRTNSRLPWTFRRPRGSSSLSLLLPLSLEDDPPIQLPKLNARLRAPRRRGGPSRRDILRLRGRAADDDGRLARL